MTPITLPLILALHLPAPATTQGLTVPEDALFAMHVTGGEQLAARLEDNSWLRFGFELAGTSLEGPLDELGLPPLADWVSDLGSATCFLGGGDDPLATFGLFVRTGERGHFAEAFSKLRTVVEESVELSLSRDGLTVYSVEGLGWERPIGPAVELAFVESGDLLGFVLSGEQVAGTVAEAVLAGEGTPPPGLAHATELLPGADVTVHLDVEALLRLGVEGDPDFESGVFADLFGDGMGYVALGMGMGKGGQVDGVLHVACVEGSLLSEILDKIQPFDHEILRWAPPGCDMVQAMGFDVSGALDWVIDLVAKTSEEGVMEEFEATLAELEDETGVDVLEDLVGQLDGTLFTFLTGIDSIVEAAASDTDEDGVPADLGFGYVFGLHDSKAFEQSLLAALGSTGILDMVEVEEFDGGNLYGAGPALGLPIGVVVGGNALGLMMGEAAMEQATAILKGDVPESAADNPSIGELFAANKDATTIAHWGPSLMHLIKMAAEEELGEDAVEELGLEGLISDWQGALVFVVEANGRTCHITLR